VLLRDGPLVVVGGQSTICKKQSPAVSRRGGSLALLSAAAGVAEARENGGAVDRRCAGLKRGHELAERRAPNASHIPGLQGGIRGRRECCELLLLLLIIG
jgi:hypothetical protein